MVQGAGPPPTPTSTPTLIYGPHPHPHPHRPLPPIPAPLRPVPPPTTHRALLVTSPHSLPRPSTTAPPLAPACTVAVVRSMEGRGWGARMSCRQGGVGGGCSGCVWRVCEECVESVWRVCGECLESVCWVSECVSTCVCELNVWMVGDPGCPPPTHHLYIDRQAPHTLALHACPFSALLLSSPYQHQPALPCLRFPPSPLLEHLSHSSPHPLTPLSLSHPASLLPRKPHLPLPPLTLDTLPLVTAAPHPAPGPTKP